MGTREFTEPMEGGECYIPASPQRSARSAAILAEVASRFPGVTLANGPIVITQAELDAATTPEGD